jgi:hypothetical protein
VPGEERLCDGHRCYAILNNSGEVESFTWVASGKVYIHAIGDSIWVPQDIVFFYDSFTFPEARGHGLIAEIARGIVADLRSSPVKRCESWIDRSNKVSLRAYSMAGFRVYGSCWVISVGPARVCSGEPKIGDF